MSMVHVAGNPALDLVGTVSERGTHDAEELVSPQSLAQWYVDAGLVTRRPPVTDEDLTAAVALREHLYPLVRSLVDGTPPPARHRTALNRAARGPVPVQSIDAHGRRTTRGDAAACLVAVARAAIELFDRDDGAVVRFCADETCTHPFLDRSRTKQRRWCDMASCGDRAKVRRFRGRTTT
jgi:predicted RNA-binding Zn ribbon-like protein